MSFLGSDASTTTRIKDSGGHEVPCLQPIDVVECTYEHFSDSRDKLSLRLGDLVYVLNKGTNGWWDGVLIRHCADDSSPLMLDRGWFPCSFTRTILHDPRKTLSAAGELGRFQSDIDVDPDLSGQSVLILTLDEFLDYCNDIEFRGPLVWCPTPTCEHGQKGHELLYYNQDLNVYCTKLPCLPQGPEPALGLPSSSSPISASKDTRKKMPIMCATDLFYLNDNDAQSWTDLTRSIHYYTNLTELALLSNDRKGFLASLDLLSVYITYIQMTFRNLHLVDNNFKKILKKLISTLSKFSINANIWFNSTPFNERESIVAQDESRKNDPFLQSVLKTFQNFHFLQRLLHFISEHNEFTILPQLFPRFFKDSFNTISWNNPFLQKNFTHRMSHDLPKEMVKAVAGASGIVVDSINNMPVSRQDTPSSSASSYHMISATSQRRRRSTAFSNVSRSSSESDTIWSKRRKPYPINEETLNLLQSRKTQLDIKLSHMVQSANDYLSNTVNFSKMLNFEMSFKTYKEVSETVPIIDILENLDLTIFINLRELGDKERVFDEDVDIDNEDKEFLNHSLSSLSHILSDYFDMKQYFHDVVVKFIMVTQHLTLEDPFVFHPMQNDLSTGYYELMTFSPLSKETIKNRKKKHDQFVQELEENDNYQQDDDNVLLFNNLINQDEDSNDLRFFNLFHIFKNCCDDYSDVLKLAIESVKQLILERENMLNYAARMMKNDITELLLQGEDDGYEAYSDRGANDKNEANIVYMDSNTKGDAEWQKGQTLLPRYLQRDFDNELIWSSNNRIKGGTKDALVAYLTNNEKRDTWFNITFLITFRSVFSTTELFSRLIARYNLVPPEDLCFEEYNEWVTKKLIPVKYRVVEVMTTFLRQYWFAGYYEPELASLNLNNFAQLAVKENVPGSMELLNEINRKFKSGDMQGTTPLKAPDPQVPHNNVLLPSYSIAESILAVDPVAFATQLSILEHEIYCDITIFDCLQKIWKNKYSKSYDSSPGLTRFINFANNLTNFISYSIVKEDDINKRAKLLSHFIFIAEYCKKFNNFSSMTAIISALYSSPIYRLEKTWQVVALQTKDLLRSLNTLMDPKKNFINYRNELKSLHSVPCVPFFGVYLSDLTFTDSGNPDFLVLEHRLKGIYEEKKYVNFNKRIRLVDILQEIIYFKKIHYDFVKDQTIIESICNTLEEIPHIEKQYQLSLIIEPKPKNKATANSDSRGKSQQKFDENDPGEEKAPAKKDRFLKFQLGKTRKKPTKLFK
ncbi:Guanine nucleotide exchange factor sdc25 [Saccharomyces pastorianus]|uniref:Guanine nucleotide exchange factor sdc25 n=1 Tax=Saccharomyces pastorianus TaxID=27292 RepID=A0A6C1EB74_SACPS|nr:Guanine nucleotide exchange factor sdc25 [Saccharomyces pastorianus]